MEGGAYDEREAEEPKSPGDRCCGVRGVCRAGLVKQDTPQQKRHAEDHPLQPHHSMFDFHRDQLLFYPSAYITFERANL